MEQNIQPIENSTEVKLDDEGEPISFNSKKPLSQKAIVLILVTILLIVVGVLYFLVFNKEDDSQLPPGENMEITEDEEIIDVEIDKTIDSDQDGLPDYLEKIIGTDENNSDTDGDSYADFDEIRKGYNPLTVEKYTEEELEGVKEIIKRENERLYKLTFIDSLLDQREILTVVDIETWASKYEVIMKSEPIFIKSDNPVDFEKEMFEDDNLSDEIIFKSVSEVQDEELGLNNIVLFGSSKTNNLINEIYKKMPVAVIYERVEEVNHHYPMMTIKMADSPWNENKKVVIVEYNRKNDDIIFVKGKMKFEKRGNYYHVSINDNNKSYAIVWNEYGDYYGLDNILQYDGKDVEIKGYMRITDPSVIKLEDSIGFLGLKVIE